MTRTCWVMTIVLIALLAATSANAQTGSQRIADLLKANQRISVIDEAGREIDGRVDGIGHDSFGLMIDGRRIDMRFDDVVRIDHPKDGLGNGAWIGFAVGAGSTLLSLALNPVCKGVEGPCSRPSFGMSAWAIAGTGAAGAGVGAAIDALIRREPTIYTRGARPRAIVDVAPAVGRGMRGAVVSVSW